MPQILWGRFAAVTAGLVGLGWVLMKATTPSDTQFYDALSPDLRKRADAARRGREAAERDGRPPPMQARDPTAPNWAMQPPSLPKSK